jgi:hypothetical protein
MKKILLFATAAVMLTACTKEIEETTQTTQETTQTTIEVQASDFEGIWYCDDFANGNGLTLIIEDFGSSSIVINGEYFSIHNGYSFESYETNGFVFTGELNGSSLEYCQEHFSGTNCGTFEKL